MSKSTKCLGCCQGISAQESVFFFFLCWPRLTACLSKIWHVLFIIYAIRLSDLSVVVFASLQSCLLSVQSKLSVRTVLCCVSSQRLVKGSIHPCVFSVPLPLNCLIFSSLSWGLGGWKLLQAEVYVVILNRSFQRKPHVTLLMSLKQAPLMLFKSSIPWFHLFSFHVHLHVVLSFSLPFVFLKHNIAVRSVSPHGFPSSTFVPCL